MTSTVAQTPVITEFDGETTEAEFLFHPELSDCVQSRVRFQGRGAGAGVGSSVGTSRGWPFFSRVAFSGL